MAEQQQHAPLSAERLQRMRERSAWCYALHMDESTSLDKVYPDLAHDYTCDVDDLMAENAALRVREAGVMQEYLHMQKLANAENAALTARLTAAMGIVQAVAKRDHTDEMLCQEICNATWRYTDDGVELHHDAPCVWQQARALMAEMAAEQQAGEGRE